MRRLRLKIPIAAGALAVALATMLLPATAATAHFRFGPHPFVPDKSIGPIHLGESETSVHLGPTTRNGPGSVFYRRYSITVGYKNGRAAGLSISELAIDPTALVTPGQYKTPTHPEIALGVPMSKVSVAYPHAQCAHHVISDTPSLVTENCLLRSHSGHTFFAGGAVKAGQRVDIGAILVTVPGAGPQHP